MTSPEKVALDAEKGTLFKKVRRVRSDKGKLRKGSRWKKLKQIGGLILDLLNNK